MSRKSARVIAGESSPSVNLKNILSQHVSGLGTYINKQYNHPAFNKFNIGIGPNTKQNCYDTGIISKPPKAPEKPLLPQMKYHQKIAEKVKFSRPELKNYEVSKLIGMMWHDLPDSEKKTFQNEYEDEKVAYQDALRLYQGSSSYQQYVRSRGKAESSDLYDKQAKRESSSGSVFLELLAPEDSDQGSEYLSSKLVSTARFHRNQRLMNEIISDCNVVSTGESIVTISKLESKRRQVELLKRHCTNLLNEVDDLERKHAANKRKWLEQQQNFLKKLKGPLTTSVHEHHDELKRSCQLYGVATEFLDSNDTTQLPLKKSKLEKAASNLAEEEGFENSSRLETGDEGAEKDAEAVQEKKVDADLPKSFNNDAK